MATRKTISAHLLAETALNPTAFTYQPRAPRIIEADPDEIERFPAPIGFVYKPRSAPVAPTRFIPSIQQASCFQWIRDGQGNAILHAVAGAGKTTTLIEALRFMTGRVFFGAYNTKIVKEIVERAKKAGLDRPNVFIKTFHSAGMRAFLSVYKDAKVSDRKLYDLLDEMIKENPVANSGWKQYQSFITQMVSFAKQFLIGIETPDTTEQWLKLVEHFCMDQELPDNIPVLTALIPTRELYLRSHKKCPEVIDFDDMLYAPLAYGCRFYQYDWVLIDEAQDCNLARQIIAQKMLAYNGRLLAVGDERQAIYGFTGAGGDSLKKISEMFNCIWLPLTVTYRCAHAIVDYAHTWVDHIEAHSAAKEGVVRLAEFDRARPKTPWFMIDQPTKDDAIICRYTKPLVACAYAMLRVGIACRIEGRDLGKNLIKLATRWKISRIDTLDARLDDYLSNEIRKAKLANNSKREAEAEDQVLTLRIFIERCKARHENMIEALCRDIESLFADNVTDVIPLLTGHKSKGREWPRVYWLQVGDRSRPGQEWQAQEELNIKYVICTRAMDELVLVPEPEKDFVQ
jgi:superfamily I DNA/RNA helicase